MRPKRFRESLKPLVLPALLGLGLAWQLIATGDGYALQYLKRAWRMRGLSAQERGALVLLGNRGAEYLSFLQAVIPPQFSVTLPEGGYGDFSQQNILQFFLLPRTIPSCRCLDLPSQGPSVSCQECLRNPQHFVPSIGNYPPDPSLLGDRQFIPFPGNAVWFHGVYAPVGVVQSGEQAPAARGEAMGSVVQAGGIDLLLYLGIFVIGAMTVHLILGRVSWLEGLSTAFPLGAGLLTWVVFVTSWARGGYVDATTFAAVAAGLAIALALAARIHPRNLRAPPPSPKATSASLAPAEDSRPLLLILLAIGAVIFASVVIVSIGRGYSIYDDIANWALKGYAIAEFKTIFAGRDWGGHGLSYPQNLHLLIALFRLVSRDLLPGSKLLYPVFLLALSVGTFRFLLKASLPPRLGALVALLIASAPVFFIYATTGYANIPFTAYLLLGSYHALGGIAEGSPREFGLGAILLGLAAWTRPEGIGFGAAVLIGSLLMGIAGRRVRPGYLVWLIPFVVISLVWAGFSYSYISRDEIGSVLGLFTTAIAQGRVEAGPIGIIAGYAASRFSEIGTWGVLYYLTLALIVLGVVFWRRRLSWRTGAALLLGLGLFLLPIGMIYVASYDHRDMLQFLDSSFDRAMLPGSVMLLTAATILAWEGWGRRAAPGQGTPLAAGSHSVAGATIDESRSAHRGG